VTLIILILVLVLLKFTIELVDRVIRQMHVQVVEVGVIWWLIFFSSESSYPLFMNIDPKWVDSIEQNVNSEIEFEVIHQIWLVDVPLDDTSLVFA
jgi:hypothetical protein